ncbi:LemA family protein [Nocardioides limicola]|uniref:LemA family protein n=1 Tax=Nocardioides limicola TaxID=2803368 RepID=UPI00193B86D4|nr:LemA family protein [Nocardioides sp. DJM-14]
MEALLTLLAMMVFGCLLVVLVTVVAMYNRFVHQRTLVDESWSQIDVELRRRHDLIPNLVKVVQAYADHERTVLASLAQAREAATSHRGDTPSERVPYEAELGRCVHSVLARAEAYPELQASQNFLDLQQELTLTEDRIAAARRFYNGNVRSLNIRVGTVPSNLVAQAFGFTRRDFFELTDPAARHSPTL